MKTLTRGLLLAGLATGVLAETERQHGAHEHGAARLSVATEGAELVIVLDSPAYNVFGFEHRPSTEAQRAEVESALARLRAGGELFTTDRAAGCRLEEARVDTPMLAGHDGDHDDEGHNHEGDDHHHDDDGHDHEDEGHHHDDEGHDQENDDHHHEGESAHSDVRAEWHFHCDDPGALARIEVGLFGAFANLDDLDVQYLTENAQGGAELTPGRTTLRLE